MPAMAHRIARAFAEATKTTHDRALVVLFEKYDDGREAERRETSANP